MTAAALAARAASAAPCRCGRSSAGRLRPQGGCCFAAARSQLPRRVTPSRTSSSTRGCGQAALAHLSPKAGTRAALYLDTRLSQAPTQHVHKHFPKGHRTALTQERLTTKHKTLRSSFAPRCSSSRTEPSDASGQAWERAWSPHTAACRSCRCAQSPARAGRLGWGPSAGSRWTAAPAPRATAAGAAARACGRMAVRCSAAPGCGARL